LDEAGHAGGEIVDHQRADDGLAVLPLGGSGGQPVGEDEGRLLCFVCVCIYVGWGLGVGGGGGGVMWVGG
jgi:hypothetical protein